MNQEPKEYQEFPWMRRYNTLDDLPQIKGYDFEEPFQIDRFLQAMATTGIQATETAKAIDIINQMMDAKAKIYLSMTSNIISSGMREIITFLVKHKFVDVIVTSAGAVEEDIIKTLRPFVVGSFDTSGRTLFEQGVGRIGNIFAPFDRYLYFERFMNPFFEKMYAMQKELNRPITPTEITQQLGLIANDPSSYLYWAAKNNIPVFCPAIVDGAIGDLLYYQLNKGNNIQIDIARDHKKMLDTALSHEKTGAIILGGGVPKHYILNANILKEGLDYAVYITTAQEFDASDSGGNQQEAMTWAKVKVSAPNVKIKCEASVVFPLIVAATFAKTYHHMQQTKKSTNPPEKKKRAKNL